ncbi:uncharacterized protein [Parasteatoda tepidariorum]|uniref:uncharacterized protein n=1 Tax=Parasteatoda tepidariorum TaxID=114398 RepID=UPI001C71B4BE|nr:uncharacterized protein LOC107457241 [Parasteatoda tepidariorum]
MSASFFGLLCFVLTVAFVTNDKVEEIEKLLKEICTEDEEIEKCVNGIKFSKEYQDVAKKCCEQPSLDGDGLQKSLCESDLETLLECYKCVEGKLGPETVKEFQPLMDCAKKERK